MTNKRDKLEAINPFYNAHGIYHSYDLERHYQRVSGGHWFDKSTIAFFRSRISDVVYPSPRLVYFVSSEAGPRGPRAYTVRSYNPKTGAIDTVGEFQEYPTQARAQTAALNKAYDECLDHFTQLA